MSREKGFSLIEVLIVLGILGALTIFATSRPKNPQKEYNRFFRRFSLLSKKIRHQAQLENATYRIVFLLTEEEGEPPKIWVEKNKSSVLLGSEQESLEKFSDLLKTVTAANEDENKNKTNTDADGFSKSKRFDFEKLKMPRTLKVKQIEISGIDYAIENGIAVVHYFPHGLVEESSIQFTNLAKTYKATIVSDSISGEIYKVPGFKSLEELQER